MYRVLLLGIGVIVAGLANIGGASSHPVYPGEGGYQARYHYVPHYAAPSQPPHYALPSEPPAYVPPRPPAYEPPRPPAYEPPRPSAYVPPRPPAYVAPRAPVVFVPVPAVPVYMVPVPVPYTYPGAAPYYARPSNCGEYRYWDGAECVDARDVPPLNRRY